MNNLSKIRLARGLTQEQVAEALGTTSVSIGRYEKEDTRLTLPLMRRLATVLSTTVAAIAGERDDAGDASFATVQIPEHDVRASAGYGAVNDGEQVRDVWSFSQRYLNEIGINHRQAAVLEVIGDSMEPTLRSGDRVLIDQSDTNPAHPGIFVIFDGETLVVKRLEREPGSKPAMIALISDNPAHGRYRLPAEDLRIVGRVVWLARRT